LLSRFSAGETALGMSRQSTELRRARKRLMRRTTSTAMRTDAELGSMSGGNDDG
jgi:hypothetical protein